MDSLLRKVKITQLEMIRDRGYDLGDEAKILDADPQSYEEFYSSRIGVMEKRLGAKRSIHSSHQFTFAHSSTYNHPDGRITLVVYFGVSDRSKKALPKENVTKFIGIYDTLRTDLMKENDRMIGILITPIPAPEQSVKEFDENKQLQFFDYNDLAINVTKHHLSSPHRFLDKTESNAVIKQIFEDASNKSNMDKLPIIRTSDRISKYFYARPYTICRVEIKETVPGNMVRHRIVYKVVKD